MNYTQKNKLIDKLCGVVLMFIAVEIFYGVIKTAYTEYNYSFSDVNMWVRIAGAVVLAIGIALLIYAYLKKDGSKASYGAELLALSFTAAALPGSYLYYAEPFNKLNRIFPIAFGLYYIIKAIYVLIEANKVPGKSKKKKR